MRRVCIFILPLLTCLACIDNHPFNSAAQFKSDTASIRSFLNYDGLNATKTPEGVWYSIDDSTLGYYPALADSVVIHFTARSIPSILPLGTQVPISSLPKVDSSATAKSTTRTVLLSSIISGMQIGLSRFPVGSSGKLFIPSGLAFGAINYHNISPNTNLVYEIKLVGASKTRLTADQAILANYISTVSDNLLLQGFHFQTDSISGIRYTYDTIIANNAAPTQKDLINLSISGNVLNSTSLFINSTDTTVAMKDQITALKIIFQKVKVGTTFTVYVPSSYGYGGTSPSKAIPANSNLVFQVKLKGIR